MHTLSHACSFSGCDTVLDSSKGSSKGSSKLTTTSIPRHLSTHLQQLKAAAVLTVAVLMVAVVALMLEEMEGERTLKICKGLL